MKKQELTKNIIHYVFPPRLEGGLIPTSATAILNGSKAILIDTGFDSQTPILLADLAVNNIEVEAVIVTHFHDDHMEGLIHFSGIPVYGSRHFQDSLDECIPKENHARCIPSTIVTEPLSLSFGQHNLTLIPFPGHSTCGILINIDNQFLHVGDEIMFAVDGRSLLPCLDDITKDINMHLDSLNKLKDYDKFTIIPSHGDIFSGEKLAGEIGNRLIYLNALLRSNKNISFEDATKDCTCDFVHNKLHEHNIL